MAGVSAVHRPTELAEALRLLGRPGVRTAVLGGGTSLVPRLADINELVDLQALGLAGVRLAGERLVMGATTTLQAVVDAAGTPPLLLEMLRREGPNTLRNAATVGGLVVGGDPESEALAALLVLEATVDIATPAGESSLSLADFLSVGPSTLAGGLVTAVTAARDGATADARVARTPADRPIVAAVGRRSDDGLRLALCGVAATPVLVDPAWPVAGLAPLGDFRGSTAYRLAMAQRLSTRVLAELAGEMD